MYSENILENISYDHLPNFIILESEPLIQTNKPIILRNMKNFDQKAFTKKLHDLHLCDRIVLSENSNTLALLNKHAPFKSLSQREINIKQKPWLTNGFLRSIRIKRRLFKKYKNCKKMKHIYNTNITEIH